MVLEQSPDFDTVSVSSLRVKPQVRWLRRDYELVAPAVQTDECTRARQNKSKAPDLHNMERLRGRRFDLAKPWVVVGAPTGIHHAKT